MEKQPRILRRVVLRWGIHACWSPALVVLGVLVLANVMDGSATDSDTPGHSRTALYVGMGMAPLVAAAYMALLENAMSYLPRLSQRDRIPYYAGLAGCHAFAHAIWMMAWPTSMSILGSSPGPQVQRSLEMSETVPFVPMMLGIVLVAEGCVLLIAGLVRVIVPRRPRSTSAHAPRFVTTTNPIASGSQAVIRALKWALVAMVGMGLFMLSRTLLDRAILPNGAPDPHQVWVMARIAIVAWILVVAVLLRLPTSSVRKRDDRWEDGQYGDHGQSPR